MNIADGINRQRNADKLPLKCLILKEIFFNFFFFFVRRRQNVAVSPVTAAEHSVICNDMRRLN